MSDHDRADVSKLEKVDAPAVPAPHRHPDVAEFWEELDRGRLSLQRCDGCATLRFPLATHCHACLSGAYHWEPIDRFGAVDVAIRVHEAVAGLPTSGASLPEPWRSMAPYLTGAVDMDSGVRLPGRILCDCGEALTRGARVRAVLLPTEGGGAIHGFAHSCIKSKKENS